MCFMSKVTDLDMLRTFALRTKHPVADFLEDGGKLNVYYLQDNFPDADRTTNEELQRVEGGYGLKAEQHFGVLKRMIAGLRGDRKSTRLNSSHG